MIRTYLHYGAQTYIIGNETAEAVKRRIEEIIQTGRPGWLRVNFGVGQAQPADLLVMSGIPIGLYTADEGS